MTRGFLWKCAHKPLPCLAAAVAWPQATSAVTSMAPSGDHESWTDGEARTASAQAPWSRGAPK